MAGDQPVLSPTGHGPVLMMPQVWQKRRCVSMCVGRRVI